MQTKILPPTTAETGHVLLSNFSGCCILIKFLFLQKCTNYILAFIIDSHTLHHSDCPHSHALQYEATLRHELYSMTPDDFWTELRDFLITFYEGVLKVPSACRRPKPKIIKR